MLVLLFILGLVTGFVVGALIVRANMTKPDGVLRIETSDPDGPYLFLQLSKTIDAVAGSKIVVLEVSTENLVSQK